MYFNAVTLDSSLKLIEYCNVVDLSLQEAAKSKQIADYEVDVMEIVEFSKKLGLLKDSDGFLRTTEKTSDILALNKQSDMLRSMLDMIFLSNNISWARFLARGRREAKFFLEGNQIQVLQWCGLFEDGEDVADWWLNKRSYSDDDEENEKTRIGRKGERKTLIYEESRTGRKPEWTALELGDREGFDVRSWVDGSEDSSSLRIEVKASIKEVEHATFFLTRNEWNTAISGGPHVFHLWPEIENDLPYPLLVTVEEMGFQVPDDPADGIWRIAEIPMATFL